MLRELQLFCNPDGQMIYVPCRIHGPLNIALITETLTVVICLIVRAPDE
jgi:hypothetical protein